MGLYDEIICDSPLPSNPPEFARKPGHRFQTKDLDCGLTVYKITSHGRLLDSNETEVSGGHFTGTVDFYGGNCRGIDGDITFTTNGEDAEWVEYRALFSNGILKSIDQTERSRKPALPVSARKPDTYQWSAEDQAACKAREAEDLTGRTMWYCHGGQEPSDGHEVTVVYCGPRDFAIQHPPGDPEQPSHDDDRLEVIDRRMRDRTLWDSLEAAQCDHDERQAEREREMAEYRRLMEERT